MKKKTFKTEKFDKKIEELQKKVQKDEKEN